MGSGGEHSTSNVSQPNLGIGYKRPLPINRFGESAMLRKVCIRLILAVSVGLVPVSASLSCRGGDGPMSSGPNTTGQATPATPLAASQLPTSTPELERPQAYVLPPPPDYTVERGTLDSQSSARPARLGATRSFLQCGIERSLAPLHQPTERGICSQLQRRSTANRRPPDHRRHRKVSRQPPGCDREPKIRTRLSIPRWLRRAAAQLPLHGQQRLRHCLGRSPVCQ